MKTTTRVLGLAALICVSLASTASTASADGIISGVVIDGYTGQPVRGATLEVDGAGISFGTGVGGDFRETVPAGTYSVTVTRTGFDPQKVTDVVVGDGGVADFAVVLLPSAGGEEAAAIEVAMDGGATGPAPASAAPGEPAGIEPVAGETAISEDASTEAPSAAAAGAGVFVGAITVEATADDSTQAALLAERRNAAQISDAIGAEEMGKNTGSDAADVVKRVVGISLQDDKFVFVRGLGGRYSNTSLNGSKIPSTEFDKKVVPLDLYPADLLDQVKVSKSYTADKPGDFAAGLVEMKTLDFPLRQSASVGFSPGLAQRDHRRGLRPVRRRARFLRRRRPAPAGRSSRRVADPAEPPHRRRLHPRGAAAVRARDPRSRTRSGPPTVAGHAIPSTVRPATRRWTPASTPATATPSAVWGWSFRAPGTATSARSTRQQNFYRYSRVEPNNQYLADSYDFDRNVEKVTTGMVGNLAYRITDNHHLKFRSIFSTISAAETRLQEGYSNDFGGDLRDYKVEYRNQETSTFQLSGEHFLNFGELGSLLEWRGATSRATTDSDLRFSLYLDRTGERHLPAHRQRPVAVHLHQRPGRPGRRLRHGLDHLSVGREVVRLVQGRARLHPNTREFAGRRLRFRPRSTAGVDLTEAPEMILVPENISPTWLRDRGDHPPDRLLRR